MDSLQATYDYSDNEEEDEQEQSNPSNQSGVDEEARRPFSWNSETSKLSELLPKPSNLFSSLPQPKSSSSISSLFSSLPPPTSRNTDASHPSPAQSAGKRIVQFRPPPVNPVSSGGAGGKEEEKDDDDYEDDKRKKKKQEEVLQTASVKSFLSSIPAPRNTSTLGVSSSGVGTGRRSIVDADVRGLKDSSVATGNEAGFSTNAEYYDSQYDGVDQISVRSSGGIVESSGYGTDGGIGDYSNWAPSTENYAGYVGVSGYYQDGDYTNYVQYGNNGTGESAVSMASGLAESSSLSRASGRRGRDTIPEEIVEVKQDELMKNRPREDQLKLTGFAFGPSYQPASTKGKPSKLHKRKHQIGSLYFDMKQKEMELEERRARGFLTKAQTQGKYGW